MSTTPYEIIAGPAEMWVADLGTAFPNVNDAPGGSWEPLGLTEGGVKAKHGQSVEMLRVDQRSGPVKAIRSEETLEVSTMLAELTLENFGHALSRVLTSSANVAATLTTAIASTNNDLTFTADTAGAAGNDIRIRYVVAGISTPLTVSLSVLDITVNVATDGAGAATSTATAVKAALDGNGGIAALINTANAAGNNGSGIVAAFAFTNLAGGADAVSIPLRQGLDTRPMALLVRGPSPYGDFNLQYEVPICVQTEEPEVEFVRDDKSVLAVKFDAIEDPDAATDGERFGRLVAQTA